MNESTGKGEERRNITRREFLRGTAGGVAAAATFFGFNDTIAERKDNDNEDERERLRKIGIEINKKEKTIQITCPNEDNFSEAQLEVYSRFLSECYKEMNNCTVYEVCYVSVGLGIQRNTTENDGGKTVVKDEDFSGNMALLRKRYGTLISLNEKLQQKYEAMRFVELPVAGPGGVRGLFAKVIDDPKMGVSQEEFQKFKKDLANNLSELEEKWKENENVTEQERKEEILNMFKGLEKRHDHKLIYMALMALGGVVGYAIFKPDKVGAETLVDPRSK